MAERKRIRELSMTREDWLRAKSDVERDIRLTEVKIVEHRNYKGPCPKCVRKTLRWLRRMIRSLNTRKLEIEGKIAGLQDPATAKTGQPNVPKTGEPDVPTHP